MCSESIEFNDTLHIITSDSASDLASFFVKKLSESKKNETLRFHFDETKNLDYFEVKNKYFKSKVNLEFLSIDLLHENLQKHEKPKHFLLIVESLFFWEQIRSNPKIVNFLKNTENFKAIIFEDSFFKDAKMNDFYEQINSFIIAISVSRVEGSENDEIFEEVEEMLANNVWKSEKQENEKKDEKNEFVKKEAKNDFVAIFDVISNFKESSGNLSPKSKKEKACVIMEQLMNNFNFDEMEDEEEENKREIGNEKDGYTQI